MGMVLHDHDGRKVWVTDQFNDEKGEAVFIGWEFEYIESSKLISRQYIDSIRVLPKMYSARTNDIKYLSSMKTTNSNTVKVTNDTERNAGVSVRASELFKHFHFGFRSIEGVNEYAGSHMNPFVMTIELWDKINAFQASKKNFQAIG